MHTDQTAPEFVVLSSIVYYHAAAFKVALNVTDRMRLCVGLHILNTSITEPGPQCNGKTVLSFKAVWHQVCQVGSSALSLISPVHMGSRIALQSGKPRSSPSVANKNSTAQMQPALPKTNC